MAFGFKAFSVALAFVSCAGAAEAANSPLIVWQGSITITKLSRACNGKTGQEGVGSLITSIYRPRLESDEPLSALSLIAGRNAQVFFNAPTSTNDQMMGRGNYMAHVISSRATAIPNSKQGAFTGTYNFRVRPITITPKHKLDHDHR